MLSELFLEFPSRVRLGCPKPYNSRHLRLPEHFQNCLPPNTAGGASFFKSGSGEGLSEPVMEFPAVLGVLLIKEATVFKHSAMPDLGCLQPTRSLALALEAEVPVGAAVETAGQPAPPRLVAWPLWTPRAESAAYYLNRHWTLSMLACRSSLGQCFGNPNPYNLSKKYWPGPSAEMCRGFLLYKFWKILPGILLEDFSGHFFPQK